MGDPNRRLTVATLWMVGAFVVGTLGYYLLGQGEWNLLDCAYMTAITLSTVGYREVVPVADSPSGQLFTIVLVFVGVGALLYFASTIMAFVIEGELSDLLGRKRMDKRLRQISEHVIVCGVGRTGAQAAVQLHRGGYKVVLVDREEAAIRAFLARGEMQADYVLGDATEEAVLSRAGIERAFGVIAALDTDHANLYVVLSAHRHKADLRIVSKVSDRSVGDKFRQVGADAVVSPTEIGGRRLFSEMTQPAITAFLEGLLLPKSFDLHVKELALQAGSRLVGRTLAEADLRRQVGNLLILAIKDPGEADFRYNPQSSCVLTAGSTLIVMGAKAELEHLRTLAAPPSRAGA